MPYDMNPKAFSYEEIKKFVKGDPVESYKIMLNQLRKSTKEKLFISSASSVVAQNADYAYETESQD